MHKITLCGVVLIVIGMAGVIAGFVVNFTFRSDIQESLFDVKYISDPTLNDCEAGEESAVFGPLICENKQYEAFLFPFEKARELCLGPEPSDSFLKAVSSWTEKKEDCLNGINYDYYAYSVTNPEEVVVDGAKPVVQEMDPVYLKKTESIATSDVNHWKATGNSKTTSKGGYSVRDPPTGAADQTDVLQAKIVVPYLNFMVANFQWPLERTGVDSDHFFGSLVSVGFLSQLVPALSETVIATVPLIGLSTIRSIWKGLEVEFPAILSAGAAGILRTFYSALKTGFAAVGIPLMLAVTEAGYGSPTAFASAFASNQLSSGPYDLSGTAPGAFLTNVASFLNSTHPCGITNPEGVPKYIAAAASGAYDELTACFEWSAALPQASREAEVTAVAAWVAKHAADPSLAMLGLLALLTSDVPPFPTIDDFLEAEFRAGTISKLAGVADYILPGSSFAFATIPSAATVGSALGTDANLTLTQPQAAAVISGLKLNAAADLSVAESEEVEGVLGCLGQCAAGAATECVVGDQTIAANQCLVISQYFTTVFFAVLNEFTVQPASNAREALREQFRAGSLSTMLGDGANTLAAVPDFASTLPFVWELGSSMAGCTARLASAASRPPECTAAGVQSEPLSDAQMDVFVRAVIDADEGAFAAAAPLFILGEGCSYGPEAFSTVQCAFMQTLNAEMTKIAVLETTGTPLGKVEDLVARQFYDSAVSRVFSDGEDLSLAGSQVVNSLASGAGVQLPTTLISNLAFHSGCHDPSLFPTASSCTFSNAGKPVPKLEWEDVELVFSLARTLPTNPEAVQGALTSAALSFPAGDCNFGPLGVVPRARCQALYQHFSYMYVHASRTVPEIRDVFGNVPFQAIPFFIEVTVQDFIGLPKEDGSLGAIDPWFGEAVPFTLAFAKPITGDTFTEITRSSGDPAKDIGTFVQEKSKKFDCRTDLDCLFPSQLSADPAALTGAICDTTDPQCTPTMVEGQDAKAIESGLLGHEKGTEHLREVGSTIDLWVGDFWTKVSLVNVQSDYDFNGVSVDWFQLLNTDMREENCDGSGEGAAGIDCNNPRGTKFIGTTTSYPFPAPIYVSAAYFKVPEKAVLSDLFAYKPSERVDVLPCDNRSGRAPQCDTPIQDRPSLTDLYFEHITGFTVQL